MQMAMATQWPNPVRLIIALKNLRVRCLQVEEKNEIQSSRKISIESVSRGNIFIQFETFRGSTSPRRSQLGDCARHWPFVIRGEADYVTYGPNRIENFGVRNSEDPDSRKRTMSR